MDKTLTTINNQQIQSRIFTIRGMQVMMDRDLAELYGVETKYLNRAVKRNIDRFPERFRFQLRQSESKNVALQFLRFQNGTLELGRSHIGYSAFTFDSSL